MPSDIPSDIKGRQPLVIVGKVSGQHGVQGWIKVYSYTRPVEQILEYQQWMLAERPDADEWQPVRVTTARRQAKKLVAKLAGIDDRNSADQLAGKWIAVRSEQLPPLPEGEYYWDDLIGLSVVNQQGVELGVVDYLIETGANDVLAVRQAGTDSDSEDDPGERLLPWSPEVIVEVGLAGGRIRVDWDADE